MKKLVKVIVPRNQEAKKTENVNHILVIDCSGSMCYDLPKIRQQLKNKLPVMVNENDTVSLVWFSGKGQFGKLVDKIRVHDLNDLERLNTAIDKWLKPMGCTGFVEPLKTVKELTGEGTYSMMFLTDGMDNEWAHNEIMDAVKDLQDALSSATFVEYGWYCNHSLLEEMAGVVGGSVVFAEDFEQYDPVFDSVIGKNGIGGCKVAISVSDPLYGLVYSVTDEGAVTYKVEDGSVKVPEHVDAVYYFVNEEVDDEPDYRALYQGLAVLTTRRQSSFIRDCLAGVGDLHLFNAYANCFGKQNMYDFQKHLIEASNDESKRFVEGKQFGLKADPNAFTVVDLLHLLSECDCEIDLKQMKYNRIGRVAEHSTELTEKEKQEMQQAIQDTNNAEELNGKLRLLTAARQKLTFTWEKDQWPIKSLTWNETRPNISLLFRINGTLELPNDAPPALPHNFPTFIYRNFTVVRDGLLNIEEIPVQILNRKAFDFLKEKGVVDKKEKFDKQKTTILNLRKLPLINETMMTPPKVSHYLALEYNLMKYKAGKKVIQAQLNELIPPERTKRLLDTYDINAVDYLKAIGVTDLGYSPKTTLQDAKDTYMATELVVKFKGMSTIPSWNAYQKKVSVNGKLNAAEHLLENYDKLCQIKRKQYPQNEDYIKWLVNELDKVTNEEKTTVFELATIRFAIIVGQLWFEEFVGVEDCKITYEPEDANPVDVEILLKDTPISI